MRKNTSLKKIIVQNYFKSAIFLREYSFFVQRYFRCILFIVIKEEDFFYYVNGVNYLFSLLFQLLNIFGYDNVGVFETS